MSTQNIASTSQPDPPAGTLYVFLHGLCAILVQTHGLEVLLPDMGATHVYRAGEFLSEVTLQPSSAPYFLLNVHGGSALFDDKKCLVAKNIQLVANPKLYARIHLPIPRAIYSVRPVDLAGAILDQGNYFAGNIVTMVQVLEYAYDDFRQLLFGGEYLDIAPLEKNGGLYTGFHIFAEEDQERPDDHTVSGFDALVQLFQFTQPPRLINPKPAPNMTPQELPIGTTMIEFLDLAPRTQELAFLGREVRQSILHGQAPMIQVLGTYGSPKTCSHLIVIPGVYEYVGS